MRTGSCLCGAVKLELAVEPGTATACHCSQCRRQSGHFWASTELPRRELTIRGEEHVSWYQASDEVRRGFCRTCGSFLFWEPIRGDAIAVAMGALDAPTHTRLVRHIFVDDQGDYYDIADGLPQNPQ